MPKMVFLEINPDYKPGDADAKKAFDALKKLFKNHRPVPMVTAKENVRLSEGMLRTKRDVGPAVPEIQVTPLEEMPIEQIKQIFISVVGVTKKQITRSEMITSIRTKMDAMNVVEEPEQS